VLTSLRKPVSYVSEENLSPGFPRVGQNSVRRESVLWRLVKALGLYMEESHDVLLYMETGNSLCGEVRSSALLCRLWEFMSTGIAQEYIGLYVLTSNHHSPGQDCSATAQARLGHSSGC
jgi:hypothetical protein